MTSGDDAQEASAPARAVWRTGRRAVLAAGGPWPGAACCAGRRPGARYTAAPPSGLLVAPGDRGRGRGGRPRQPGGRADPDQRRALGPLRDRAAAPAPSGGAGGVFLARGRDRNPGAVSGSGSGERTLGRDRHQGRRAPGPFSARLVPAEGASGAPSSSGRRRAAEVSGAPQAVLPRLALNGLWGDDGLRRTVLPSGLTDLTRERPDTASVALRLAVQAGSRDEDTTSGGSLAGARLLPGHHLPPQRPGH